MIWVYTFAPLFGGFFAGFWRIFLDKIDFTYKYSKQEIQVRSVNYRETSLVNRDNYDQGTLKETLK